MKGQPLTNSKRYKFTLYIDYLGIQIFTNILELMWKGSEPMGTALPAVHMI